MRSFALLLLLVSGVAEAGGGLVLQNDTCIITIGFYEAHFTAYQPQSSGDEEFCENLPARGETVVVLDYLHRSLKEVPVDYRIIRNTTGKGEFARLADIEALPDLGAVTVFYKQPAVQQDGRFLVEFTFAEEGEYIGIVTAGHPVNDKVYVSVFPFTVGRSGLPWGWFGFAVAVLLGAGLLLSMKHIGARPVETNA
ncbi:MAG: hypothetical protein HKN35_14640 [Woeseia sp.]|nr:hypothetical protein [Woeseia sp.]NNE62130.1 hypothetical protein [Woeseia sp.]